MATSNITLCLTIGKRPELLRQTLNSLLDKVDFFDIIAINDFRDEETNAVFRELCPSGNLINLPEQVGHHKAVDTMYAQVKTDYIFHCEDDWLFDQPIPIAQSIQLLKNDPSITLVCVRKIEDMVFNTEQKSKILTESNPLIDYTRLDPIHEQWYGYSFNPHVVSTQLWHEIKAFSKFKKERHVSRWLRQKGKHMVYLSHGACQHIGEEDSVSVAPTNNWMIKMKRKFFG